MDQNPFREGLLERGYYQPVTFVVFGASGDLFSRKLLPSFYNLFEQGLLPALKIIGFARKPWDNNLFRQEVARKLSFPNSQFSETQQSFLKRIFYLSADYADKTSYLKLFQILKDEPLIVFYLAIPAEGFLKVIANLAVLKSILARCRIAVEKPFGYNLATASFLSSRLAELFKEKQIFRLDHYLGKETVQNLLVLRFANTLFEPLWNKDFISYVEITVAETVGLGERGAYYEKSGAMRDMLQNHLFQLLSLTAMEQPQSLTVSALQEAKLAVLRSLELKIEKKKTFPLIVGQYSPGYIDLQEVCGYRQEKGVDPLSMTETYVALRLFVETPRWQGVPFFLRTGKRLSRRVSEIRLFFKVKKGLKFFKTSLKANLLCWKIQPNEGMQIFFNSKLPDFKTQIAPVSLDFAYENAFAKPAAEAYTRLLLDLALGDQILYMSQAEVEASWAFCDRLLAINRKQVPLYFYPAGSAGPAEADRLIYPWALNWSRL